MSKPEADSIEQTIAPLHHSGKNGLCTKIPCKKCDDYHKVILALQDIIVKEVEEAERVSFNRGLMWATENYVKTGRLLPSGVSAVKHRSLQSKLKDSKLLGMEVKVDHTLADNEIRFDHPDGRSEGFRFEKENPNE